MSPVRRTFDRVCNLGSAGMDRAELRRVRLTNQAAVLGVFNCGAFAAVYFAAGAYYRWAALVNVLGVSTSGLAVVLNAQERRVAARLCLLLPVHAVVVAACFLVGSVGGFSLYFPLFAAVAFLVFGEEHNGLRKALAATSLAAWAVVRYVAPSTDGAPVQLPPSAIAVFDGISAAGVTFTLVACVALFTRDTVTAERLLSEEHARSERLLLNILPAPISKRLKQGGEAIADGFAEVTVLFADLVGFTTYAGDRPPEEVVRVLNRIFSAFDDLCETLGLEKIKTIGDAYMVAAGLPVPRADHAEVVARMALAMREALAEVATEEGCPLALRIGIHTGPVVAGVIGKRKFIYDLWGDTVNVASRMESSGIPGEIQLSGETAARLSGTFDVTARGSVSIKGKGAMETFLLRGLRTEHAGLRQA
jgi:guanylate cyclase